MNTNSSDQVIPSPVGSAEVPGSIVSDEVLHPSPGLRYPRRHYRFDDDQSTTRSITFLRNRLRHLRRIKRRINREDRVNRQTIDLARQDIAEVELILRGVATSEFYLRFQSSQPYEEPDTGRICFTQLVYVYSGIRELHSEFGSVIRVHLLG